MKKLKGLNSELSSFENKKLSKLEASKICGGSETRARTKTKNGSDYTVHLDNGKDWTIEVI